METGQIRKKTILFWSFLGRVCVD